ncbi:MAG: hypothetical protein ACLSXY_04090 [Veillonella sp.]
MIHGVVDFLISLAIFNVADIGICIGSFCCILFVFTKRTMNSFHY